MNDSTLDELEHSLNQFGISLQQLEKLYPKLYEPLMNLSVTGVSPRTYFYWKKSGLIATKENDTEEKGWVKINLIDYVWIKIIETMRDFGVPFEKIKETKELMFTNFISDLAKEKDDYIKFLREKTKVRETRIKIIEKALVLAKIEMESSPEEFLVYHTILGGLLMDLLINNDKGYITISKKDNEYEIGYFSFKSMSDFQDFIEPLFDVPCLHIPIKSLIEDFIDDARTEKYIETISFLNLKEMKVINAIRERNFKEIVIKPDSNNKTITIDLEKDGDILDQRAKEVKRILGLNEYSEVTIKFRNEKHLYFKNKTRL